MNTYIHYLFNPFK